MPKVKITQETRFADIIVPTMDLIRGSYILGMLLTNNKKVSSDFIAQVGFARPNINKHNVDQQPQKRVEVVIVLSVFGHTLF